MMRCLVEGYWDWDSKEKLCFFGYVLVYLVVWFLCFDFNSELYMVFQVKIKFKEFILNYV